MWGLSFLFPNFTILGDMLAKGLSIDARTWTLNACLTIWAIRLAWHIGARHTGEDYRYVSIRERLSKRGQCCYYILAYLYIFML